MGFLFGRRVAFRPRYRFVRIQATPPLSAAVSVHYRSSYTLDLARRLKCSEYALERRYLLHLFGDTLFGCVVLAALQNHGVKGIAASIAMSELSHANNGRKPNCVLVTELGPYRAWIL